MTPLANFSRKGKKKATRRRLVATSPLVSSHFFRFSVAIKSIPPHFENMLRKGGAAGYGFGGGGLGSHELPRPNGSSYSGGGLGGGKKSSAARRKRLLLRLGSLGGVVLFLIVLVSRQRRNQGRSGDNNNGEPPSRWRGRPRAAHEGGRHGRGCREEVKKREKKAFVFFSPFETTPRSRSLSLSTSTFNLFGSPAP